VDVDELSDHQEYIEGRGIYDERNRVNDPTGREWKFATKSVIPEQYPPDLQHELRSEHGGQKPPRLCTELIQRFSKAGDTVLDPFAGVGGTLLAASLAAYEGTGLRDAIGFEINEEWINIYYEARRRRILIGHLKWIWPLAEQDMRQGDCLDLIDELESEEVDFLLTDVPYWDMDKVEQNWE